MQVSVSNGTPRQEVRKAEGATETRLSGGKDSIAEDKPSSPQDSVEISGEGRVMQKALSNAKVLTMPQESDSDKVTYDNPKTTVEVKGASSKEAKAADAIRLNQAAASIAQGKTISPAAEKALKEGNPQLYAQAKAKAKLAASQAKAKAEAEAKAQEMGQVAEKV